MLPNLVAATAVLLSLPLAAEGSQFSFKRRGRSLEGPGGVFEWAGTFGDLDQMGTPITWSMQKATGTPKAYADATMKFVALNTSDTSLAGITALETEAANLQSGTCATRIHGTELTPGNCYTLTPNQAIATSTWSIVTTGITALAIFTEHVPTEFEDTAHYLYNATNFDIEPIAQESPGIFVRISCLTGQYVDANGATENGAHVKVELKCGDSDCGSCNATRSDPSGYCWEEDHDGEKEFIKVDCYDGNTKANMSIYEGAGVVGCANDTYLDKTEALTYVSGECKTDAHGHHTHGDHAGDGSHGPNEGSPQQSGAADIALAFTPLAALLAVGTALRA